MFSRKLFCLWTMLPSTLRVFCALSRRPQSLLPIAASATHLMCVCVCVCLCVRGKHLQLLLRKRQSKDTSGSAFVAAPAPSHREASLRDRTAAHLKTVSRGNFATTCLRATPTSHTYGNSARLRCFGGWTWRGLAQRRHAMPFNPPSSIFLCVHMC